MKESSSINLHVHPNPAAEIVVGANGNLFIRNRSSVAILSGVPADELSALLQAARGNPHIDSLTSRLAHTTPSLVEPETLAALDGTVIQLSDSDSPYMTPQPAARLSVGIVANGTLGYKIWQALGELPAFDSRLIAVESLAASEEPLFRSRAVARVLSTGLQASPRPPSSLGSAEPLRSATFADLVRALAGCETAVCALEGMPYRVLQEMARAARAAAVPLVFVSLEAGAAAVGPLSVSSGSTCFLCSRLSLYFADYPDKPVAAEALELFTGGVANEAAAMQSAIGWMTLRVQRVLLGLHSGREHVPLYTGIDLLELESGSATHHPTTSFDDCPLCTGRGAVRTASLGLDSALALFSQADGQRIGQGDPGSAPIRRVGVIGGGTAGYLTALALRAQRPELEVSVIESSAIPVIGVGEATTPPLVEFLHDYLSIDKADFYYRVRPTWKLGIQFFWGLPGDYSFNYPFGRGRAGKLLEAYRYGGNHNLASIESMMMTRDVSPMLRGPDGRYISLLDRVGYAYHLDNERFIGYLQTLAAERGVAHIDCVVAEARLRPDREEVECLIAADGRRLQYDLYVDCTGFRSLLMGRALNSPHIPYDSSLFADTAVVADVPHDGLLRPYTQAESMNNGWCWRIPQLEEDHRGYVFSSRFCTLDEAVDEMRAKNPRMGSTKVIRFRSGRHAHAWKGNVVALGNAYGFVEPLESTAIHMLTRTIRTLVDGLPSLAADERAQEIFNRKAGGEWDYLRSFLSIHYRFNRKFDTPFWQECRRSVDISGIQELLEVYRRSAPLDQRADQGMLERFLVHDPLFGLNGLDNLLLGQAVPCSLLEPSESRDSWNRRQAAANALLAATVPQREALARIDEEPGLLSAPAGSGNRART